MANNVAAAQGLDTAVKGQCSQALTIQTYCNSLLMQPQVNFQGFTNLQKYQTSINAGLATAQDHANLYLNTIQPTIITNITNIANYYSLVSAIPTALPPGSTTQDWIDLLNDVQTQSLSYQQVANSTVTTLQGLHGNLTSDSASFSAEVSQLNSAVNGDNGYLKSINDQLSSIQSKIDGAIAGIAISGLAIAGGVFLTAVGAITDFVTAGTTTPLVVGGVALILAGVGGEVASALALKALDDSQASLLQQKSTLTDEVKLAMGISSGYNSLVDQAQNAVTAATAMENAWGFLSNDLGSTAADLQSGATSIGAIRTLYLTAANTTLQTVQSDITTIKTQMSGVNYSPAPAGTTIGDHILALAQAA